MEMTKCSGLSEQSLLELFYLSSLFPSMQLIIMLYGVETANYCGPRSADRQMHQGEGDRRNGKIFE